MAQWWCFIARIHLLYFLLSSLSIVQGGELKSPTFKKWILGEPSTDLKKAIEDQLRCVLSKDGIKVDKLHQVGFMDISGNFSKVRLIATFKTKDGRFCALRTQMSPFKKDFWEAGKPKPKCGPGNEYRNLYEQYKKMD